MFKTENSESYFKILSKTLKFADKTRHYDMGFWSDPINYC